MTMITLSDAGLQSAAAQSSTDTRNETWQWHMQHAIRDIASLASYLDVDLNDQTTDFPLLAPLPYLDRVVKGDKADPLLRQILPRAEENESDQSYSEDPLGEIPQIGSTRGFIQKYSSRGLVVTTGTCAVNCRYCFRRHFPYDRNNPSRSDWDTIYRHFETNPSLAEAILSGGDPLVLGDRQLLDITTNLAAIESIDTIRLHTRVPVVIPQRICAELLDWVDRVNKKLVFVLHINHPNEISNDVIKALSLLRDHGVTLLNQSVLLRGVNDDANTLVRLSRQLFEAGVLPYYLHLLDPVAGAQHFDVTEATGINLVEQVRSQLPGYLVPRLAREIPGANAKQIIAG